ncbi:dihydrolipoyllysine-residue acetyltransferase [Scleromatobacter humisilvae]|uniref:Acetyltransferase component of pyruvate dehydrogenase complex n=1 Tax=Scleromatobacter humisilvae TaxID=2897159 RepID=A0A9X2C4D1_9BURK|nr:dihydrolipoyllysine-residue acetyltransferase [Scleromatobacter humisilvae]MCK9689210.1 dihydrolipoyllysine-residue acetyltransferase [Scleromatobacter humisilvae]
MALVEVKVPDIGDFKDVAIIELLVKPGDNVKAEQSLLTVESDKASMEIPSSAAGVVKELKVAMGDKINEGTVILTLETGAAAAPAPAPAAPAPAPAPAAAAPAPAPAPAAAPASGGSVEIEVPDIGDFADVGVIELLVKVGDVVKAEQSLITVESDKASMEIPSSHAGTIKALKVKVGDRVSKGSVIATIEATGGAAAPASAPAAAAPAAAPATASAPAPAPAPAEKAVPTAALPPHEPTAPPLNLPHASPTIRRTARELGVPLEEVKGSGPHGRILQADLEGFVKSVMAGATQTKAQAARTPAAAAAGGGSLPGLLPWPQVDFAKFGQVERKDLSRIKKISGANLHRNWVMIPHVTNHDDADITELEAFRVTLNKEYEKAGVKVTMLAFLIKACVAALKKFPEFNASLDGEQIVYKKYFHIGFAADTPNGLMVPVIRDADQKGIVQIAKEMNELAGKARDGKLGPADMTGGCFSISSLGGIGGTYFTPIINAPEVAILGVCKSATRPVWDGKAFQPRLILPLSLSWDHRVVDGAAAARFNTYLGQVLADFRRVML